MGISFLLKAAMKWNRPKTHSTFCWHRRIMCSVLHYKLRILNLSLKPKAAERVVGQLCNFQLFVLLYVNKKQLKMHNHTCLVCVWTESTIWLTQSNAATFSIMFYGLHVSDCWIYLGKFIDTKPNYRYHHSCSCTSWHHLRFYTFCF